MNYDWTDTLTKAVTTSLAVGVALAASPILGPAGVLSVAGAIISGVAGASAALADKIESDDG
jgi:hypothetical protein